MVSVRGACLHWWYAQDYFCLWVYTRRKISAKLVLNKVYKLQKGIHHLIFSWAVEVRTCNIFFSFQSLYVYKTIRGDGNIIVATPVLQRPLQNKQQATERYINRSSWYLFRMHCKTGGSNHDIAVVMLITDTCVISFLKHAYPAPWKSNGAFLM